MALDLDEFDDDLAEIISDLPVTFTYSGADYTGMRSAVDTSKEMEDGGYLGKLDLVLVARTAVFTVTTPGVNSLITISGVVYRVATVLPDTFGKGIKFGLVKQN
jgi:hypothetical protein